MRKRHTTPAESARSRQRSPLVSESRPRSSQQSSVRHQRLANMHALVLDIAPLVYAAHCAILLISFPKDTTLLLHAVTPPYREHWLVCLFCVTLALSLSSNKGCIATGCLAIVVQPLMQSKVTDLSVFEDVSKNWLASAGISLYPFLLLIVHSAYSCIELGLAHVPKQVRMRPQLYKSLLWLLLVVCAYGVLDTAASPEKLAWLGLDGNMATQYLCGCRLALLAGNAALMLAQVFSSSHRRRSAVFFATTALLTLQALAVDPLCPSTLPNFFAA